MQTLSKRILIAFGAIVILAATLAAAQNFLSPNSTASWTSMIPALIAIGLAFATHRVSLSLGIAIFIGAFIAVPLSGVPAQFFHDITGPVTDMTNLKILTFVLLLIPGLNIVLKAGGIQDLLLNFASWASEKRSTQLATIFLGVLIFVDDYANTWMVGSTMQDPCEKSGVSRAKLAFLVDATSAPIAGIAFVSTWIGYELGLFQQILTDLNVPMDPYSLFLEALPYRFYCILMLVFVVVVAYSGRDFGPMLKEEIEAYKNKLDNVSPIAKKKLTAKSISAIIALTTLFVSIFVGFLWSGDASTLWANGQRGMGLVRSLLSSVDSVDVLAWSSVVFFVVSSLSTMIIAKRPMSLISRDFVSGIKSSLIPISILVLSWGLKSNLTALHASQFLSDTFAQNLTPALFPMTVFILASVTAFCTGTSWGTMAILIPTLIPLAHTLDGGQLGLISIISCAAILDGAIFGDHCSPISDTTIMSATASDCDLMTHARTQMPYALLVGIIAAFFAYIPAAMGMPGYLALGMSAILMIAIFWRISKKVG